ncbi:ATP-binding protein [Simkania negevensis]|uniref:Uncharacterized protein MJ1544 n=1 Tax=Simkania negevensis (strain ATCC VR-1471 / DSM 27360 / Z) TaxID=331113 RepID=F8L4Z2_SIMNZ|nr:ATP-binding protein [Simkania negevensis]CCB89147.1 uncharacterized protein MJ1544 [Simkania negevensis Z]
MKDLLQTLIEEFRETIDATSGSIYRHYKFPDAQNAIKVAVGMRRAGKTYFLFQTIRDLIKQKVSIEQILYLNFEDDRIVPMDYKSMGKMIDLWYTLYPENHQKMCHLFLDEVQNIEGWPLVLRRLSDTKNLQIYVTGSSAKLLSKEIATSLRGRSLSIEIFPYSYLEYLDAHEIPPPSKPYGKKCMDHHRKHLLEYFQIGGFPGVQKLVSNLHLETLQNYVETVIFRDIIERHQITNIPLLKYFTQSLLKNVSSPLSINKFYNDIKSQGLKVAKDTLYSYLSYLEDVFLIFPIPLFTESLRKLQTTPKKIYAIDNGLINSTTFNTSQNLDKFLENQVYLDLRRQKKSVYYYITSQGYEIDFVVRDQKGNCELLQVVWDMDDVETRAREERALEEAKKELGFPGKIIDYTTYLQSQG